MSDRCECACMCIHTHVHGVSYTFFKQIGVVLCAWFLFCLGRLDWIFVGQSHGCIECRPEPFSRPSFHCVQAFPRRQHLAHLSVWQLRHISLCPHRNTTLQSLRIHTHRPHGVEPAPRLQRPPDTPALPLWHVTGAPHHHPAPHLGFRSRLKHNLFFSSPNFFCRG